MKWFYNLKVSTKLISSFLLIAFIAGVVGIFGINNIKRIDELYAKMNENQIVSMPELSEITSSYLRERIALRNQFIDKDSGTKQKYIDEYNTQNAIQAESLNKYETTILNDATRQEYDKLKSLLSDFDKIAKECIAQMNAGNSDKAYEILLGNETAEIGNAIQQSTDQLFQLNKENAKSMNDSNIDSSYQAVINMIIILVIGIIMAIALGIFISRIISRPVKQIAHAADQIANGDLNLSVDIKTKDEIGSLAKSFEKMVSNTNEVLTNVSVSAEQVASGSQQVSNSSMSLSQGTTEQASSIEELTAALEEMSAQTNLNAKNADQANELAESVKGKALKGDEQMKEMLTAMDEINESSESISKIIKVIDDIAFQTNILALNAAVEAARAGQHGKGFAVVAEEVRNLAARSASAAKETTDMIEGSIKKTEGGTKIAKETADALNHIIDGIGKVSDLIHDIAVSSNEQATGINQISQGISQVSQVVQNNSATSQESAAASEELSSQAMLLQNMVNGFKLRKKQLTQKSELTPEMVTMLQKMEEGNKKNIDSDSKAKIILSDNEFGKY